MQFTRLKPELFHMDTNLNPLEAYQKITLLLTDLNINHVGYGLNQYFPVIQQMQKAGYALLHGFLAETVLPYQTAMSSTETGHRDQTDTER